MIFGRELITNNANQELRRAAGVPVMPKFETLALAGAVCRMAAKTLGPRRAWSFQGALFSGAAGVFRALRSATGALSLDPTTFVKVDETFIRASRPLSNP